MKYIILAFLLFTISCSHPSFQSSWTTTKSPDQFKIIFETTKGSFVIEAHRDWSPNAVDRLFQLVKNHYFRNTPIYRVVPNFVAQFGGYDTALNNEWEKHIVLDEPVIKSNVTGTMSVARGGKNTRNTQFYINLKDNIRLDTSGTASGVPGFPVIANVVRGMDVVRYFYSYRDTPRNELHKLKPLPDPVSFFKQHFPKMDYIKNAYIGQ